jgi:pre-mRNA-splicing factor CDC5/CEF1
MYAAKSHNFHRLTPSTQTTTTTPPTHPNHPPGKKAKRKAREKMLLEAKRLASLQKRRELKAAGLELKMREKKRKYIDYGREIPFHRQAPAGFYATGEEKAEGMKQQLDPRFEALRVDKMEAERRDEAENRERAQDRKRQKKLMEENLPQLVMAVNNLNDPVAIRKRAPLSLPAPQVSDQELEEIVKLGQAGALAGAGGDGATAALLGDYRDAPTPLATPMRTPRQAAGQDVVMQEARNLLALQRAETPLKGGEAVVPGLEEGTGFDGHVPRSGRITTPSVLSTGMRGGPGGMTPLAGGATPLDRRSVGGSSSVAGGRAGLAGGATPMRDQLGLNLGAAGSLDPAHQQLMVLSEKKRQKALRAQLAEGLSALPEPQYSYEISIPELDEEDAAAEAAAAAVPEDAADRDAREAARRRAQEEAELERRSTVLKRGLPRPPTVDPEAFVLPKGADVEGDAVVAADQAVLQELLGVLRHDNAKYPVGKDGGAGGGGGGKKGKKSKGGAGGGGGGAVPHLPTVHPKLLDKARAMVAEEAGGAGAEVDQGELEEAWLKAFGDLAYFPNRQAFGRLSGAAKQDRLAALIFQFDALSSSLERDAKKVRVVVWGGLVRGVWILERGSEDQVVSLL